MKKVFIWLFLLLQGGQVMAQSDSRALTTLSIVPQYILNHGIRIDYEKQIGERSFLQIAPQFYLAEKTLNRDISQLNGIGCGVFHKIFLLEDFMKEGFYLSYGLMYNFYSIEFQVNSYDADRLPLGLINKIGADLVFGYQVFEYERLIFDLYLGLGTRYSIINHSSIKNNLDNYFWSYYYTGNILVMGFRIGCVL